MLSYIVYHVQVTNLIEEHEYYFRVFAHNAAGPSEQPAELKPPVKARLPFGTQLRFSITVLIY